MTGALLLLATFLLAFVGLARVLVVSARIVRHAWRNARPQTRLERRIARRMRVLARHEHKRQGGVL